MELLPRTSFARTAKRNPANAHMHLNCAKQFHVITLAQLAWRDIKVMPRTNSSELYHDEAPGLDLTDTVYAMDPTTIDL